jgi:uncharacterized protein YozE (UPF0346 family)
MNSGSGSTQKHDIFFCSTEYKWLITIRKPVIKPIKQEITSFAVRSWPVERLRPNQKLFLLRYGGPSAKDEHTRLEERGNISLFFFCSTELAQSA